MEGGTIYDCGASVSEWTLPGENHSLMLAATFGHSAALESCSSEHHKFHNN